MPGSSGGRRDPPGRAWPGARVCAGSQPPLQANGGGRPQPLRRAARFTFRFLPLGCVGSPPGPALTPPAGWPPPVRGLCRQSKTPPLPPHDHPGPRPRLPRRGAPPQPRHPGSPRISRRRAARCRARTWAPNKERRRMRPPHTRPPHFRRAGVSKFFPWATAPRPPARPRFSPPPLQRGAKFRGLVD